MVLHSGSFANWTYADELLRSTAAWPAGFVLVIHTRYEPDRNDKYVQTVQQSGAPNTVLSTEPLSSERYEELVASADIGLVLHKAVPRSRYQQKNTRMIGLSSGKFSYYMKYGLPVISAGQQSYEDLLKEYAFGENLRSFGEMGTSLTRVLANYDRHRAEAHRLFREKLDFDVFWPGLSARLLEVMK